MDLFLRSSLREQSIWKHFEIYIQTPSSIHIDGSPAEDANLFYCTAITENICRRLRRAEEVA